MKQRSRTKHSPRTTTLIALCVTGILLVTGGCGGQAAENPAAAPKNPAKAKPSPTRSGPDPSSTADGLPAVPVFDAPPAPERAKPTAKGGKGATPVFSDIKTTKKIAFITIDDGAFKEPKAAQLFRKANVPVTLFLQGSEVDPNPGYFRGLQDAGADIQDHTQTHTELPGLSSERQRKEICGTADKFEKLFKKKPTMFRPPYGSYDDTTLTAAKSCGFKSVALWRETVDKGKIFYQRDKKIYPGDIVLMHFRPAFIKDYVAVLNDMKKSGVTPARLSDYIG